MSDNLVKLSIGSTGTYLGVLHYDALHSHAFITQAYGEKKFFLYPPEQSEYLYPTKKYPNVSSLVNIGEPDLECYPLFSRSSVVTLTLKPGETLFVLRAWWHATQALTASISVSTNNVNWLNWREFIQEVYGMRRKERPAKIVILVAYLIAVGMLLRLGPWVTGKAWAVPKRAFLA